MTGKHKSTSLHISHVVGSTPGSDGHNGAQIEATRQNTAQVCARSFAAPCTAPLHISRICTMPIVWSELMISIVRHDSEHPTNKAPPFVIRRPPWESQGCVSSLLAPFPLLLSPPSDSLPASPCSECTSLLPHSASLLRGRLHFPSPCGVQLLCRTNRHWARIPALLWLLSVFRPDG